MMNERDMTPDEEKRFEALVDSGVMNAAEARERILGNQQNLGNAAVERTVSRPKRTFRGGDRPGEPRDPHYDVDTTGQLKPDQQAGWRMVRDAGKKPEEE